MFFLSRRRGGRSGWYSKCKNKLKEEHGTVLNLVSSMQRSAREKNLRASRLKGLEREMGYTSQRFENGLRMAADYTWKRTAEKTFAAYRAILAK